MNFNPTDDRVIIEPAAVETKTNSGFFIPTTAANEKNRGTVISTGPGKKNSEGTRIPVTVAVGDKVIYSVGAGTPVKVSDKEFIIVKEDDIICVVSE